MKSAVPHVSVWLDDPAPGEGVLAYASEWAGRFGWPLRALSLTEREAWAGDEAGQDDLYVLGEGFPMALKGELLRRGGGRPLGGGLPWRVGRRPLAPWGLGGRGRERPPPTRGGGAGGW